MKYWAPNRTTVNLPVSKERTHMHIINTQAKLNIQTSGPKHNLHENYYIIRNDVDLVENCL